MKVPAFIKNLYIFKEVYMFRNMYYSKCTLTRTINKKKKNQQKTKKKNSIGFYELGKCWLDRGSRNFAPEEDFTRG